MNGFSINTHKSNLRRFHPGFKPALVKEAGSKCPLSLRERARERGYKIKQLPLFDPLSPTLPLRGRE
jgi:hypothetical protein